MFKPIFSITPKIARALMRIEATKQAVTSLPTTPQMQTRLRETARLLSNHYSTQIEGNRLTLDQATRVIKNGFLVVSDSSKKNRRYVFNKKFSPLLF